MNKNRDQDCWSNDADKWDPIHDWACQYLADPGRARKLVEMVEGEFGIGKEGKPQVMVTGIEIERLIGKGEGQFRSIKGYADVVISYRIGQGGGNGYPQYAHRWIIVDAKTNSQPLGTIIRQLENYRYFLLVGGGDSQAEDEIGGCVLATTYTLSVEDVRWLRSKQILHIRLGKHFDDYCDKRSGKIEVSDSVEL